MSRVTSYATNSTLSIQTVDHSDLEEALGIPWVAEAVNHEDLREVGTCKQTLQVDQKEASSPCP